MKEQSKLLKHSKAIKNSKAVFIALAMMASASTFTGVSMVTTAKAKTVKPNKAYKLIKWQNLMPKSDLLAIEKGSNRFLIPDGSANDTVASPIKNKIKKPRDAYEQALMSVKVVEKYNKKKIRLPGFIVPVDVQGEGITKEFFFVPFFGACLHLPPPPPNQIIYAKYPKGMKIKDLYEPFYIEATLYTKQTKNDMANSAYYAKVANIYPYTEPKKN